MIPRVALFAFIALTGCASIPSTLVTVCEPIPRIDPPMPEPVILNAPEFYVVSSENVDSFNVRIKEDSNGVFYAITPVGYTILAQNVQELRRYIRELQQVIVYYKRYDENFNVKSTGASKNESSK